MKSRILLVSFAIFILAACNSVPTVDGPGMITNFGSMMNGRSTNIRAIIFPGGKRTVSGLSVGGTKKPGWRQAIGRTTGISGDTRGLPEWLDFEWQEPSYPGLQPQDFTTREEYSKYVFDEKASLPIKTQRVLISSRIPPEIIQEAIDSRAHIQKGQGLPEKSLWLYFIWTDDGIKFRWDLYCIKPCVTKEGGDEID